MRWTVADSNLRLAGIDGVTGEKNAPPEKKTLEKISLARPPCKASDHASDHIITVIITEVGQL
jgi:hypothetical protein